MYVFVVEPKGRFFKKISQNYEIYLRDEIHLPFMPYYLCRINEEYSMEELKSDINLVTPTNNIRPRLFYYTNGENEYFEEITRQDTLLLKNLSSGLLFCPATNIHVGDIIAFFFFLALKDSYERILKRTLWQPKEIEEMKYILLCFLVKEANQRWVRAKMN